MRWYFPYRSDKTADKWKKYGIIKMSKYDDDDVNLDFDDDFELDDDTDAEVM